MRVALIAPISHRVPPDGYGPWERVVADLANGLHQRGHDVTVFAAGGSELKARTVATVPYPLEDWQPREAPNPRIWEEIHIAEAMLQTTRDGYDIVHNHLSVHPLGFAPHLDIPLVTTLHGIAWNRDTHPALARYQDLAFVSISDSERRFFPGLRYVATVYNGVDPARFVEGPGSGGHLLFAGRLAPEKAPNLAIEAAIKAGVPLRLAGPVEEKHQDYFEKAIKTRLRSGEVEYLGSLSATELSEQYRDAVALLSPLAWEEPFGLVVAEAMMSGTPVIGWRRGALPELITEGVSGFLVDDVEGAVEVIGRLDDIDRSKCRMYAVEHLGVRRMVDGYEAVYERLTGRSDRD